MNKVKIEIAASLNGHWRTVHEADLPVLKDGTHRSEGSFSIEGVPDFLECTFMVEDLPRFTITPEYARAGIMTGSLRVSNRLFFITIVPEGKIFNYNAGFIPNEKESAGFDSIHDSESI